jgi:DNA-directed RNA polymerase specialized sigma24 family protein
MPAAKKHRYLTREEIDARIHAVTTADCIRLEGIARAYAEGTRWSSGDLLQEAFVAVLTRRQWRADLDLTVFLVGVMRSLAFSRRKGEKRDPLTRARAEADEQDDELSSLGGPSELEPSQIMANEQEAEQVLKRLTACFKTDPEVLAVLRGRARGDSPAEIRTALGMNQTQYESVCRRMLRGYEAYRKARR